MSAPAPAVTAAAAAAAALQGQEGCLARRLLLLLPEMGPSPADQQGLLLTEAVTLLLLLLYDSHFKFEVTVHLLDCYEWLLQLVGEARESEGEALSAALDRLTVQLFNAESVSCIKHLSCIAACSAL